MAVLWSNRHVHFVLLKYILLRMTGRYLSVIVYVYELFAQEYSEQTKVLNSYANTKFKQKNIF